MPNVPRPERRPNARPRRTAVALALAAAGAGCGELAGGSLALTLDLPPRGDLRPAGMTEIALTTTPVGGAASVTTTPLTADGASFSFASADVAAGVPITMRVELRDAANRLVGFGAIDDPVTPRATDDLEVAVAVRKPMLYVSGGSAIVTVDTTRDVLDPKYQAQVGSAGQVVTDLDGTELAVFSGASMVRVSTANHKPVGDRLTVPGGSVTAAVAVPGQRRLVAATTGGVAVIDVDAGAAAMVAVPGVPARVAIGGSAEAGFVAYVLSDRVPPRTGAGGACPSTSSRVTAIRLTDGTTAALPVMAPLSDLAADAHGVFATDPCGGQVIQFDGAGFDGARGHKLFDLQGASALTIADGTLWAAGSTPGAKPPVDGADGVAARVLLANVPTSGGTPQVFKLPPKTEAVNSFDAPRHELSVNLQADTQVVTALAAQPSDGVIALVTQTNTTRVGLVLTVGLSEVVIVPDMDLDVRDVLLVDRKSGGVLHRLRARCAVVLGAADFPNWKCTPVADTEAPTGGEFTPTGVTALFGGR